MKWLARAKAWAGTLLAPAEDPRLAQRPMLKKVNHALGVVANTKQTLETKMTNVQNRISELDKRAREALINDQEEQARSILHRWQISMSEYQSLEEQLRHVQQEQHQLTLVKERLTYQIEANLIDEAQKELSQALDNLGLQDIKQKRENLPSVNVDELLEQLKRELGG